MELTKSLTAKCNYDVNDKYLRLKQKSIQKLISLPPKYLGNVSKGIDEAIFKANKDILEEFGGIPIEIVKKTLLQNSGTSIDDHPFIQFYVNIDCIIFTPKVGKKVRATVHKIGDTYVGCLICDRINTTIFKRFKGFDRTANPNEEDEESAQLNSLAIGQQVIVKIEHLSYEKNDLFIKSKFVKAV